MVNTLKLLQVFEKEMDDQLHKFDMKAVMDLDQVVSWFLKFCNGV